MKPIKKVTDKTKDKTKKVKKNSSSKRLKELEDLVLLMDKKIISLEQDMVSMKMTHNRIKIRMGV